MTSRVVCIDLVFDARLFRAFLAGLLVAAPLELGSETLMLTTTYPAPSGVYNQIITVGASGANTVLARSGGSVLIGTSDPVAGKLIVMGGNVGVNVLNPGFKLQVDGEIGALKTEAGKYGAMVIAGAGDNDFYSVLNLGNNNNNDELWGVQHLRNNDFAIHYLQTGAHLRFTKNGKLLVNSSVSFDPNAAMEVNGSMSSVGRITSGNGFRNTSVNGSVSDNCILRGDNQSCSGYSTFVPGVYMDGTWFNNFPDLRRDDGGLGIITQTQWWCCT